ncbi:MAG: cytochrome c [Rhodocyclaceae bacterium]|nr:cytochrome c [Rhodocyclaceae bacterium]
MKKTLAVFGCALLAFAPFAQADEVEDTIKARQAAYRLLAWNTGIIKANVQGEFDAKKVQTAANTIAAIAHSDLGALYAPGTDKGKGYYPTKAKPAAFTDDKVVQVAMDFVKAADALAAAAQGGDKDAVKAAFGELGGTCKACHDDYRAK